MSASSYLSEYYKPSRGRLNLQSEGEEGCAGGWVPKADDKKKYFCVDLLEVKPVTGVIIQGLDRYPVWVTEFSVQFKESADDAEWTDIGVRVLS